MQTDFFGAVQQVDSLEVLVAFALLVAFLAEELANKEINASASGDEQKQHYDSCCPFRRCNKCKFSFYKHRDTFRFLLLTQQLLDKRRMFFLMIKRHTFLSSALFSTRNELANANAQYPVTSSWRARTVQVQLLHCTPNC